MGASASSGPPRPAEDVVVAAVSAAMCRPEIDTKMKPGGRQSQQRPRKLPREMKVDGGAAVRSTARQRVIKAARREEERTHEIIKRAFYGGTWRLVTFRRERFKRRPGPRSAKVMQDAAAVSQHVGPRPARARRPKLTRKQLRQQRGSPCRTTRPGLQGCSPRR